MSTVDTSMAIANVPQSRGSAVMALTSLKRQQPQTSALRILPNRVFPKQRHFALNAFRSLVTCEIVRRWRLVIGRVGFAPRGVVSGVVGGRGCHFFSLKSKYAPCSILKPTAHNVNGSCCFTSAFCIVI